MAQFEKNEVVADYKLAHISRQLSILGRKEVLTGKAKFGIFGDGKEVAQLAMAKVFRNGDFRSGYYRDQTFMMAIGLMTPIEFFAQLYGDTDLKNNPATGGRLMNNHFSTQSLNPDGTWRNLTEQKNSSPDISPTAGQMPRLLGLGLASKLFRISNGTWNFENYSINGNEVAFGTIGDASTSEGHFFETLNAAGVMQIPMAISIWDDGYGISVSKAYQTTKENISEILKGLQTDTDKQNGYLIYRVKGWDYIALCEAYAEGVDECRKRHIPVMFHITELTQPQGHSTSGSHERYKSKERLEWEVEFDALKKLREWILQENIATVAELDALEAEAVEIVRIAKETAWENYIQPILAERQRLIDIINQQKTCMCRNEHIDKVTHHKGSLQKIMTPIRRDNFSAVKKLLRHVCIDCPQRTPLQNALHEWMDENHQHNLQAYSSHLYSETEFSALKVKPIAVTYDPEPPQVTGREILRDNFDALFSKYPELLSFGEDVGKLGGVNQTYEGLQAKYGEHRIFDTGIREATIMGQAIGLALRGFRPIAEIQYFDYLLYALQTMSDDLATVRYRSFGQQKAPVIVSTRGHRLEGIWHSGSPMSMVINSIRGMHVCVPRNMTQAAGFYNTILESDDPALIIEPLNSYRFKEKRPSNLGEYKVQLGIPEIMIEGTDMTIVTYGSCVKIAEQAVEQLYEFNINCELIDIQTLLPFDLNHVILQSIKKTNKVLFFDEDVPGGATAYMYQKVMEEQNAFQYLDLNPRTLTAKDHRPAYSSDGDYFSKTNAEDVFDSVYDMMHEFNPNRFPKLF